MPERVQRGLGLVVVALIALLVSAALRQAGNPVLDGFAAMAGLTTGVCGLVGLILIAVGLLRD